VCVMGFFETSSPELFAILLISASWVARMTSVSQWNPAQGNFHQNYFVTDFLIYLFIYLFIFCSAGCQTQDLKHARQMLYDLLHPQP
jgi:hypothetical protein